MNRILITISQAIHVENDEDAEGELIPENVEHEANLWRDEVALQLTEKGYRPLEHTVVWDWSDDEGSCYDVDYHAIIESEEDSSLIWDELWNDFASFDSYDLTPYE